MPVNQLLNELIEYAFSDGVWISKAHRIRINERYPATLVKQMDEILYDSGWPHEPWTTSKSLEDAAAKVAPILREKYPELDDKSITLVLNNACFSWK